MARGVQEDLEKAKYLDCCLLESWRLWPTATGYARKLRSDVWYKDMLVPQGSVVIVSQLWVCLFFVIASAALPCCSCLGQS